MKFSLENLTTKVSSFLDNLNSAAQGKTTSANQTSEPSFWQRYALNFSFSPAKSAATNNQALRQVAQKVDTWRSDGDDKKKPGRPPAPIIKPPPTNITEQDEPKRGYQPYELTIVIPEGQETLSYHQLESTVIKNIFDHNKVGYSRASIEDVAEKEKIDFSPQYNYQKKDYEYNDKDGLWLKSEPRTAIINGKQARVVRLTIPPDVQQSVMGNSALSETVKASGKKTFAELNMNERMQMAMQMSYDKHYLPHDVQEALKHFDPKQLMAGMVVAGGIMYVATKAGAAKAIPFVGAGVTMAQITYYYAHADAFLAECARAKSPEELDEAAKDFSVLVKQGGVDLTITLATAGASQLGKVSRAGGELVGLVEDGVKATTTKLSKWNEEIVAGMRQTFGEDLAVETNAAAKASGKPNLLEDPNLYSKSADDLGMLKGSSSAGKDAITETAEQGLTNKAQASAKRLKSELSKDEIKAAKEQLVTLNVARTEMMSRLEEIANDINLSPGTRNSAETARNAIRDHSTQNDLAGALRDVHDKPVVKSGSGKIYDHLGEVRNQALAPLENLRDKLLKEMTNKAIAEAKGANPDFSEHQRLSKEVDAISEMITKIKQFLEIGK